jgi:hypothetical protein
MFKDSDIILDTIRRSFLSKSATASMFTSNNEPSDSQHNSILLYKQYHLKRHVSALLVSHLQAYVVS